GWRRVATLPGPIELGATQLLDDRVLVIEGGQDFQLPRRLWLFDPASRMTSMSTSIDPRFERAKTRLLDGRVLISGGLRPDLMSPANLIAFETAEIFDPIAGA